MKSIILLLLIIVGSNVNAEMANKNAIIEKTSELIQTYTELDQFNGVVILEHKGQIILEKHYGMTDSIENFVTNPQSRFIIASVSKLLTKLAIYKLEEEGKLSVNDYLNQFFPNFPQGNKITIDMMLSHRSGITRESGASFFEEISMQSIIDSIQSQKLEFEPGTRELYSNAAYIMLAGIIEKVSGKKFENYMLKNIYKPLKMKNTGMFQLNKKIKHLTHGYIKENNAIVKLKEVLVNSYGCGGIYSTAKDLITFSKSLSNTKYISQSVYNKMKANEKNIGWIGANIGYRAYFNKFCDNDFTVIILSNYHLTPINEIVSKFKAIYHGEKYELPKATNRKAITLDESIMKKYEGVYALEMDTKMKFEFKMEDGKFYFIQLLNNDKSELHAESENKFFYDFDSEDTIVFDQDEKGNYSMIISAQGMQLKGTKVE